MKKYFVLIICLLGSFCVSCYDLSKNGKSLLALASSESSESAVVSAKSQSIIIGGIENVAQQLISKGMAKVITYEGYNLIFKGKKFIVPIPPYTYENMEYSLQIALKKALGSNWQKYLDSFMNDKSNSSIVSNDIPKEITALFENNCSYSINSTLDTGVLSHIFTTGGNATAREYDKRWWAGVDYYNGYWWLIGASQYVLTFSFEDPWSPNMIVEFRGYDDDGDLITWSHNGSYAGFNPMINAAVNVELKSYNMHFGVWSQPKIYFNGWIITYYPTPDDGQAWTEVF